MHTHRHTQMYEHMENTGTHTQAHKNHKEFPYSCLIFLCSPFTLGRTRYLMVETSTLVRASIGNQTQ